MDIAIMETGRINEAIADQFERYPEMFRTMFERAGATEVCAVILFVQTRRRNAIWTM